MAKNTNITASGDVYTGRGSVAGVIVNSHSNGTLILNDSPGGASGRAIFGGADGYTFASGSQVVEFPEPLDFYEGLYAEVGGTADLEIVYNIA